MVAFFVPIALCKGGNAHIAYAISATPPTTSGSASWLLLRPRPDSEGGAEAKMGITWGDSRGKRGESVAAPDGYC